MLKTERTELHAGLKKPVRILQLSDIHLSYADDVDGDAMKEHALHRRTGFDNDSCFAQTAVDSFREALDRSAQYDLTVITGDLVDFVSHANKKLAREMLAGHDYMITAGNHEFTRFVGAPETLAYRRRMLDEVKDFLGRDFLFDERELGGLEIITIDNSYSYFTEEQFRQTEKTLEKGLPTLVFMHLPPNDPTLWQKPAQAGRALTEQETEVNIRLLNRISDAPNLLAVFAGHWHSTSEQELPHGRKCYVVAGLYRGVVREIVID